LVTDADSFRPGKWKRRARRFVGDTLNTLDDREHRRRRLLLQPALDRRRVDAFVPAIVARAEQTQATWTDAARITLRDEIDRLSLLAAGDGLPSTDLESVAGELAADLWCVMRAVPRLTPPVRGTSGARALARVDRAVEGLVAERRRRPQAEGDLL